MKVSQELRFTAAAQRPSGSGARLLRKGDVLADACPSREILMHITSRWGVLVLLVLETGTLRFSELKRAIGGINERMLAQTLQRLESDGLLDRIAYEVVPPHVEYSLTALGREAAARVRSLSDWIEESLPRVLSERARRANRAE